MLDLQQKFDDHKAGVAKFNRIYATHQALADDLARLEELNREAQARLVQVEVSKVEKYPQVSVIERSGGVSSRIGPDYLVLVGGILAAAVALGVFSVWLYGYLGQRKPEPAYVTLSGVHFHPQESGGALVSGNQPDQRISRSDMPLLEEEYGDSEANYPDANGK